MEFMRPNPNITSERVKSHLQKYRKNRDRSRKEFMTSYENSLQGYKNQSGEEFDDDDSDNDRGGLTCGEAAAFCTHVVSSQRGSGSYESSTSRRSSPVPMNDSGGTLHLPMLSTEERDGPIGRSFDCLMGLFQSLSQQLEASRGGGIKTAAPSAPIPASSQSQQHPSHQQSIPHSVEQAVVNAASSMHQSSSFNEVAYSVPHNLSEPIRVSNQPQVTHEGHHHWQGEPARGNHHQPSQHDHYDTHAAHQPQKQAPQYHHSYDEIPSIPHSPRVTHAQDPGKPQAQMATAPQYAHSRPMQHAPAPANQYESAPHEYQATPLPPPQQSSASTTKAQKESTIMEQEMRGQRAFQHKMRAMMQNEMNKYGGNEHETQSGVAASSDNTGHAMDHSEVQAHSSNEHSPHMTHEPDNQFWNIENDDEIFDFLMQS